jgi:hypothetical protein
MLPYAIILGTSKSPRLTEEEIEILFDYTFEMHDHNASKPQPAIFWHRDDHSFYWKYVN